MFISSQDRLTLLQNQSPSVESSAAKYPIWKLFLNLVTSIMIQAHLEENS